MLRKVTVRTPKKSTGIWLLMTIVYVLSIIVNEHFTLLEAFEFPEKVIAGIKLFGVLGYLFLTTANFIKKPNSNHGPPS